MIKSISVLLTISSYLSHAVLMRTKIFDEFELNKHNYNT